MEIPNQEKLDKPDQHEILECALATSRGRGEFLNIALLPTNKLEGERLFVAMFEHRYFHRAERTRTSRKNIYHYQRKLKKWYRATLNLLQKNRSGLSVHMLILYLLKMNGKKYTTRCSYHLNGHRLDIFIGIS